MLRKDHNKSCKLRRLDQCLHLIPVEAVWAYQRRRLEWVACPGGPRLIHELLNLDVRLVEDWSDIPLLEAGWEAESQGEQLNCPCRHPSSLKEGLTAPIRLLALSPAFTPMKKYTFRSKDMVPILQALQNIERGSWWRTTHSHRISTAAYW